MLADVAQDDLPVDRRRTQQPHQRVDVENTVVLGEGVAAEALHGTSLEDVQPLEVFMGAWREKYDSDPDPAVIEAFREILLQESHS